MRPSFVIVYLCDNDYGSDLHDAARLVWEMHQGYDIQASEERLKSVFVDLMVGLSNLRAAYRGFSDEPTRTREYLTATLRVVFSATKPTEDHDGGSIAIDWHLGYIWRF